MVFTARSSDTELWCCGRRFKTAQGRAGHRQFKHDARPRTRARTDRERTLEQLSRLTSRIDALQASVRELESKIASLVSTMAGERKTQLSDTSSRQQQGLISTDSRQRDAVIVVKMDDGTDIKLTKTELESIVYRAAEQQIKSWNAGSHAR